jgi:hypothetical protein
MIFFSLSSSEFCVALELIRFLKSSEVISELVAVDCLTEKIELMNSRILISGQRMYLIISKKKLEKLAIFSGDENANNFGVISPNISIRIVISIISIVIIKVCDKCGKYLFPILIAIRAAEDEAATFTIVFPSRIMMSNSRGFFRSLKIRLLLRLLFFSIFFSWIFVSEKKAVSEPEKKADKSRKPMIAINEKLSSTSCMFLL